MCIVVHGILIWHILELVVFFCIWYAMNHTMNRLAAAAIVFESMFNLFEFIILANEMRKQEIKNVTDIINCFNSQLI